MPSLNPSRGCLKKKVTEDKNRPTKLAIPNSDLGGNAGDMGLDNTPMPPMDAGGQDMESMGDEAPMSPAPTPQDNGDDDELMNIVNGMSAEDKAAVIKYAKSMAEEGGETPSQGQQPMPEAQMRIKDIVDETINSILDKNDGNRDVNELPKKYKGKKNNPFVSPY